MDERRIRESLELERDRLERVKLAIEIDEGSGQSQKQSLNELSMSDQHPADIGTETFERSKDFGILENVHNELADVDRALRRLQSGSYGVCEACGRPIGAARLEALPAARFCIADQARAEREARSGAHLP